MLSDTQVRDILVNLGWLSDKDKTDSLCVTDAVRKFQEFYGLGVDGDVGNMTRRTMLQRMSCGCGNPDVQAVTENASVMRWRKLDVKYFIDKTPNGVSQTEVVAIYDWAWKVAWGGVCGIDPERVRSASEADVIMSTGRGKRSGFDGPSGVLAWSQMPADGVSQIEMRFDLDEVFGTADSTGRIKLPNVAAHEIGHAKGISHIAASRGVALMNPIYASAVDKPRELDIAEAVMRYGDPKTTPVPPTTPPTGGVKLTKLTLVGDFDVTVETV